MTSLELVEFINADRKLRAEEAGAAFPSKGFAELRHDDFLRKVPEVLSEEHARNFSAMFPVVIGNGATRQSKGYRFPKREACLMAMSYSYELQAKVFDRMTVLEAAPSPTQAVPASVERLQLALVSAQMSSDILNIHGSARLGMVRKAHELAGAAHLLPMLPSYSIDAPRNEEGALLTGSGSSEVTVSITDLLESLGSAIKNQTANKRLIKLGLLADMTRPSTQGDQVRKFKAVTAKGLKYGKNITHPNNPKETQAHWFVSTGAELVRLIESV
jgi:hypothetical protein